MLVSAVFEAVKKKMRWKMEDRQDDVCEYGKTICSKSLSGEADDFILWISVVEAQVRNPLFSLLSIVIDRACQ